MPGAVAKEFLMAEDTTLARNSSWSPVASALVADVLRGNGLGLRVRMRVHGESMLPALWPGSEVEIESCSLADVSPGEIVLALRDGRLFLHRLVGLQPHGFVLCGDCISVPDPQYPQEALLGRLVRGTRAARGLGAKCSRAAGMVLCRCSLARRLVLRLHSRRQASTRDFQSAES